MKPLAILTTLLASAAPGACGELQHTYDYAPQQLTCIREGAL